jgi:mRNA interferase RelE/StbE
MEVLFAKQFLKDVHTLRDAKLASKVEDIVLKVKSAHNLSEIKNVKKLAGFKTAYRVRIGDYRIGFLYEHHIVTFSVLGNRKEIYRKFP